MVAAIGLGLLALAVWGWWQERTRRSTCTVFVDDAVLGRLPAVCALTGVPSDRVVRLEQPVHAGSPLLLLLLLLGPIGLVLLVLAYVLQRSGGTITALLPVSSPSVERYERAVRTRWIGWGVLATAVLAIGIPDVVSSTPGTHDLATLLVLAWAVAGAALIVLGHVRALAESVRITLDGSRRWMTLRGVHPEFAAAVRASESLRSTG